MMAHPVPRSCTPEPAATCTRPTGRSVGKEDPVLQILGLCALISDCCFLSQRCRQRSCQPLLWYTFPHCCKPPLLKWLPGYLKGQHHFSFPSFFSFSLLGANKERVRRSKATKCLKKIESDHAYPWKSTGGEKTWEELKFIHQAEPWHRDSPTKIKNNK